MGQYEVGTLPVRSSPARSQRPAGVSRSFRWVKVTLGQPNSSVSDPAIPLFSRFLPPTYVQYKNIHIKAAKKGRLRVLLCFFAPFLRVMRAFNAPEHPTLNPATFCAT